LINNFTSIFRSTLDRTFYPVLEQAIGFGSAFEGWIASRDEGVYRVLLPLTPPAGHTFHLERYIDQQRPGRNFRIRVELECSCPSERPGMNMLCFRHHPDVIRRITQQPSLLELLCTDSYLDVTKTVYWFYVMVRTNWRRLPQSRSWNLELLPSKHFCNLKLTNSQESFQVKVMFGVQRYTSDIFISSRPQGAHTPSTMWPESYGIAETKFMGHMARQVPEDSSHLKCLQLLVGALACDGISIYSIKTIFMHLLNTTPVSQWHTKYFLLQLSDVLGQLRLSLENKYLEHFILGNQRLPEEIRLPPDVQTAYPPNHFYGLRQDPAANSRAMQAYLDLRNR
ncbi:IPIL1 protein, partial [Anthoscopus minutus]|nr:IPIL1 protein [Anthoscopus minutus]